MMSTNYASVIQELIPWLRSVDAHAGYHLELLGQAEELLSQPAALGGPEAKQLARRLERWRYQHLTEREGAWDTNDWRLADLLDGMARQLAARELREPRATYRALFSTEFEPPTMELALWALDQIWPLKEVTRVAQLVTQEHFSVDVPTPTGNPVESPAGTEGHISQPAACRKRRMFMYAPLYLSSYCVNFCRYCGFRFPEPIDRKHLSVAEARREAEALVAHGFRHILLVAGDYPQLVTPEYVGQVARQLVELGVKPGVEIAPLDTADYELLVDAGVCSITLYQETYNLALYKDYHPRGPKTSFLWRLEALDRAAEAGIRRLGLGILLGLSPPQEEFVHLVRHGMYLAHRFPGCRLAFSLPRIHEAPSDFSVPYPVNDNMFIRLYCALRLCFPRAELVLSTRERPKLRDRLASICITQMSAGSSTAPGGYTHPEKNANLGKQFPVHDSRPPARVFDALKKAGFQLVWQID